MDAKALSPKRLALILTATIVCAPAALAQTRADCASESTLKSVQAGGPVELSFRNASAQSRRLYWIDPTGDRKFIAVIAPGSEFKQTTNAGHAWVATDDAEKCLSAVVASAAPETIDASADRRPRR